MKITAFNSSPRSKETSKTEMLLQSFLAGAARAGAATETLYLKKYHINHCSGCFACWLKGQGRCVQEDDMTEELLDRLLAPDIAVLATPLYHFNMNARMKTFIERTLPMLEPTMEARGDRTHRPLRVPKVPRIVALSVCAFPEQYNFQALSLNLRMIFGPLLIAEIYRHSSEFLPLPQLAPKVGEVLAAAVRAGEEVVRHGKVEPATLAALTQDLAPKEQLINLANKYWNEEIARHQEETERGHVDEWA
ncbi:MAG: flavodoxin family protein [Thermodesulfobacteriota bacterium]